MGQFDVYRNGSRRSARTVPYLLDLQADLLAASRRRVVAPLVVSSIITETFKRLTPTFEIEGVEVIMSTLEIASVPNETLQEQIASLKDRRDDIMAAIDFLFFGI